MSSDDKMSGSSKGRFGKSRSPTSRQGRKSNDTGTGSGNGGSSATGNSANRSAGDGSHRSSVARRFLGDEDDLDIEPEAIDLLGDSEVDGRIRSSSGGANIFDRRDNRTVDQSVNLMGGGNDDAYESSRNRKMRGNRPVRGLQRGSAGTSMVDVFLDYATADGPGQRGKIGDLNTSRKSKCKKLVFSTRFLVVMVGIVVVTLGVVFGVTKGNKSSDDKSENHQPAVSRMARFEEKIVASGTTQAEDLQDTSSSAFKALRWIVQGDEAAIRDDDPGLIQRYVMAVLYYATQPGDIVAPVFTGWKESENWMSKADVCDWWGVDCEKVRNRNVIVHCNLTNNQLQGTIPSEIKQLSYLTELDLSGNRLSGTVPEVIGELTDLSFLMLQDNELTGRLPSSMGNMAGAEEIILSNNKFEGLLPQNIGYLEKLRGLRVDNNGFSGPLPEDWKQKGMNTLHVQNNDFRGRIPHQLFQLTSLVDLRLGHNFLTGTIPPEIESIYKLEILDAQMNRLNGELPNIFDRLHFLKEINLHHNSFNGFLPSTLGKCTTLESLLLDSNFFTGSIPKEWDGMSNLHTLVVHHNKLQGSLPALTSLGPLRQLWLNDNNLSGEIPAQLGSLRDLTTVHLENNKLIRGQVPAEIGNLKMLETLRVFNTSLTGTMPSAVCELRDQNQLETLDADCNDEMECDCCTKCF